MIYRNTTENIPECNQKYSLIDKIKMLSLKYKFEKIFTILIVSLITLLVIIMGIAKPYTWGMPLIIITTSIFIISLIHSFIENVYSLNRINIGLLTIIFTQLLNLAIRDLW